MSSYNQLINNLGTLKLTKMIEMLPSLLESNRKQPEMSLTESLLKLTDAEITFRDERARKINVVLSSFPYHKTIKDFDFSYQPQINKSQIEDLCSLRFLEIKSNVIFIGSPGVGKTHLATAIGIEAASQRLVNIFHQFLNFNDENKESCGRKTRRTDYKTLFKVLIINH